MMVEVIVIFAPYILFEYARFRPTNTMLTLLRTCQAINETSPPSGRGFVTLQVTKIHYQDYFDADVNYSVFGAIVAWQPEYCRPPRRGAFDVDPAIRWGSEPSPVGPRPPVLSWYVKYFNVSAGNLTIADDLFKGARPTNYFQPPRSHRQAFIGSKIERAGFTFLGQGGYYFRPARGNLSERLRPLEAVHGKREGRRLLMAGCQPGDVRVRHLLFAPPNISAFGYFDGKVITKGTEGGVIVGFVQRGIRTARELLADELAAPDRWPATAVLLVPMFATLWVRGGSAIRRAWYFTLAGLSLLFAKSVIMPNSLCMNPHLWGTITLLAWARFWNARNIVR
jgi:hypothetical protein